MKTYDLTQIWTIGGAEGAPVTYTMNWPEDRPYLPQYAPLWDHAATCRGCAQEMASDYVAELTAAKASEEEINAFIDDLMRARIYAMERALADPARREEMIEELITVYGIYHHQLNRAALSQQLEQIAGSPEVQSMLESLLGLRPDPGRMN